MWSSAENLSARSESFREDGDDEDALRWAALERLPTYRRVRRGIFRNVVGDYKEIDVQNLQVEEQRIVLDRLINSVDDDWEKFFTSVRRRFDSFLLPKVTLVTCRRLQISISPTAPNWVFKFSRNGIEIGNMSRPVMLVSLLLILVITSQFEWRQQLVSDAYTTPNESQKQQQILGREEGVKEKIILSQEKSIQRLTELVRDLKEQLQQCHSNNETSTGAFSS